MSAVPTIQIPIHLQATANLAQNRARGVHIGIAALVQNQVDHSLQLKELHLVRFHDWRHEDHRKRHTKFRNARKKSLLQQCPGLLSCPQAMDLQEDDWTPGYIISASIPAANLKSAALGTDLDVYNVIWQYKTSKGPLALTLYINHIDPASSGQCIPTSSRLLLGKKKGLRFVHASYHLMEALHKQPVLAASNEPQKAFDVGLRVAHTVVGDSEFYWQAGFEAGHPGRVVLKEKGLTPYSLADLESRPGMFDLFS